MLHANSDESTPYSLVPEINQPGDNQSSLVHTVKIDNSTPRTFQLLELRCPKREAGDSKGKKTWSL